MATVLIADDAMFMRKVLGDILTKEGHEVIAEAETGDEAILQYKRYQPDLVLLDITMPERNGFGALNGIIAFAPDAKIVMCSALGEESMVQDCLEDGARDFIVKPFQPERVAEAVVKALSN